MMRREATYLPLPSVSRSQLPPAVDRPMIMTAVRLLLTTDIKMTPCHTLNWGIHHSGQFYISGFCFAMHAFSEQSYNHETSPGTVSFIVQKLWKINRGPQTFWVGSQEMLKTWSQSQFLDEGILRINAWALKNAKDLIIIFRERLFLIFLTGSYFKPNYCSILIRTSNQSKLFTT